MVRAWCLDFKKLIGAFEMSKSNKNLKKPQDNEEKDIEYYKLAAKFWEYYAKTIENELAKQDKKNFDALHGEFSG